MKSTEKTANSAMGCFKVEDFKFFHTGDMKSYVIPDTSKEYSKQEYAYIRIHLFLRTTPQTSFILQKTSSGDPPYTESSFTTLIDYVHPFTYEYMESFVISKFAEESNMSIHELRFHKMELSETNQGASELVYFLLGNVEFQVHQIDSEKFSIVPHSQIKAMLIENFLSLWMEIIDSNEFPTNEIKTQRNKTGLIVGRFQPVHLGHLYLFKKALESVECLKIGVGSSQLKNKPKNPFSYEERKSLITQALLEEGIPKSRFKIYPIPDLYNFTKWKDSIFTIVQEFDVLFTNNLWIGRLVQQRGKSMVYGLQYNFTKYNGTQIRKLLSNNDARWKKLVPLSAIPFLEKWQSKQ